jgi:hypothetical protein
LFAGFPDFFYYWVFPHAIPPSILLAYKLPA